MNKVNQVLAILLLVVVAVLIVSMGNHSVRVGAQTPTPWIDVIYTSSDPLGAHHILHDTRYGPNCQQCHDGTGQDAPKSLVGVPYVTMGNGQQCTSCHDGKYVTQLFISQMTTNNRFYSCSDCHQTQ